MMVIAALFIIVKTQKQSRCPLVGEWINKLWYIWTMEYYSALKRNELSRHEKIWRKLKCILQSERNQSEKAIYDLIPTIWHSGRGETMEIAKRLEAARCWGGEVRMNRQSTDEFGGNETAVYDSIMVDTYHNKFVQTYRLCMHQVWTNINYGLWVTMMCQCRFTGYNKCTPHLGNIDNGEGWALSVEIGYVWEVFRSSPQFCCESKTALKDKVQYFF